MVSTEQETACHCDLQLYQRRESRGISCPVNVAASSKRSVMMPYSDNKLFAFLLGNILCNLSHLFVAIQAAQEIAYVNVDLTSQGHSLHLL